MKKIKSMALGVTCIALTGFFSFTAFICKVEKPPIYMGECTLLSEPAQADHLYKHEVSGNADYTAVKNGAETFAAKFAAEAYASCENKESFAVSPVSVYTALALAAECADGVTRQELLSALGVSYTQLLNGFSYFYRNIICEETSRDGEISGMVSMGNSIWLDDRTSINEDCIKTLSEKFFCYSYNANFLDANKQANDAVREFVRDQTKGLIDQDFNLSEDTLITLINTLYLKNIWNRDGDELWLTDEKYDFKQSDGSKKDIKLLQGYYNYGRVQSGEGYKTFFTTTYNGCKLKFIVPEDGVSTDSLFSEKVISEVCAISDYKPFEEGSGQTMKRYHTRCLFPEYEASCDMDVKPVLKEKFAINSFFNDNPVFGAVCNFSNITIDDVYCSAVKHVTKLKVNKKGIEGAAVTAVIMDAATAMPPDYEDIYETFVIDKSFAYILQDENDITLFSGVVNKV